MRNIMFSLCSYKSLKSEQSRKLQFCESDLYCAYMSKLMCTHGE